MHSYLVYKQKKMEMLHHDFMPCVYKGVLVMDTFASICDQACNNSTKNC